MHIADCSKFFKKINYRGLYEQYFFMHSEFYKLTKMIKINHLQKISTFCGCKL